MKNNSLGKTAATTAKVLLWVGGLVIVTVVATFALLFVAVGMAEGDEDTYY